ncbi:hypothetical protein TanjilG_28139 [Lupinus angustifolius]|uniref:Uncharacterized protein n=1 Tax=Lupinus angustifolius TaxID=3871 RepID=A0A1J7GVT5_LUPAN|nr:hypothetical protein TanjilG_28139 [Lupinus angustifolius]
MVMLRRMVVESITMVMLRRMVVESITMDNAQSRLSMAISYAKAACEAHQDNIFSNLPATISTITVLTWLLLTRVNIELVALDVGEIYMRCACP